MDRKHIPPTWMIEELRRRRGEREERAGIPLELPLPPAGPGPGPAREEAPRSPSCIVIELWS